MGEGIRDSFVENDVIGNFAVDSKPLASLASVNRRKKRKKSSRKNKLFSRKRHNKHRRRRRAHTKRSGKIKYTKRGQPYKIMPNGRARFLKKR